jgi:hypothetical protein
MALAAIARRFHTFSQAPVYACNIATILNMIQMIANTILHTAWYITT